MYIKYTKDQRRELDLAFYFIQRMVETNHTNEKMYGEALRYEHKYGREKLVVMAESIREFLRGHKYKLYELPIISQGFMHMAILGAYYYQNYGKGDKLQKKLWKQFEEQATKVVKTHDELLAKLCP